MQKQENVVIKKECHSRTFLSGIHNARRCQMREISSLNKYVEDPRQKHSGMTAKFITTRGFTLIELLVVVLIIGILAAVALPQYQRAVNKARLSEAKTILKALSDAADVWALSHDACGTYNISEFDIGFDGMLDGEQIITKNWDISVEDWTNEPATERGSGNCISFTAQERNTEERCEIIYRGNTFDSAPLGVFFTTTGICSQKYGATYDETLKRDILH